MTGPDVSLPTWPERPLSIADFLTDGSLTRLCAEVAQMTGRRVELRDEQGNVILPAPASEDGKPWRVIARGDRPGDEPGTKLIPLRIAAVPIGFIAISPGSGRGVDHAARMIELIALNTGELCEHELELRQRIKELEALFRLGSLLAHAESVDRVLSVALELALDALGLDAGAIVLLKEDADGVVTADEEDLSLKASKNLSRDWLECPLPLSKDRLFDRMALSGQIVVSEDLAGDDRVLIADRAASEGLGAAIHAGLIFQDRPVGILRLYARAPRVFGLADQRLLRSIAQQAAVAVEQAKLLRIQEEETRVQRQLELAADVQRRMLPRSLPDFPGLDIAARCTPSAELGGDFYDFLPIDSSLGVVVGDVVGKGIAAALMMSAVRSSMRAHARSADAPEETVAKVNRALCRDTLDHEFVTLWHGLIDPRARTLLCCSAGHDPPLLLRTGSGTPELIDFPPGGMVLGVDPEQAYTRQNIKLRRGDVLIVYTDGVTDIADFGGAKFGRARLRQSLLGIAAQEPNAPAGRILDLITWDIRRFAGLAPRRDDETIVVIRAL